MASMRKATLLSLGLCLASTGLARTATGQAVAVGGAVDVLELQDLKPFRAPASNWQVVGRVAADRHSAHQISLEPGVGVLVNVAPPREGEDLLTSWEHGDLELELEFMMPKGGNSGIYLQGQYEVQLADSWGVDRPGFGDVGGIYERWDPRRGAGRQGYEGRAPLVNAGRAPGLWQDLKILFRAPRFDSQGAKIENARFDQVVLNGVVIHENVEVTGPTRGSLATGERAAGPLRFQGDHGPVAFRNIRYHRFGTEPIRLSGLRYRVYEDDFSELEDLAPLNPVREGSAETISASVAGTSDGFALAFEGTLHAPRAGMYTFETELGWMDPGFQAPNPEFGAARLTIGGRDVLVLTQGEEGGRAQVRLDAGPHPFSFSFFKGRSGPPMLTLHAAGPGVARQALHDPAALPIVTPIAPIEVQPGSAPVVLRSFVQHGSAKRTHAVSVGDPAGVHYAYDLARGALLHAWRGPFVGTTGMWHRRGFEQLAEPLGSTLTFSGAPAVAALPDRLSPWPDSARDHRSFGYDVDPERRPIFLYHVGDVEVEDRIRPVSHSPGLHRELRLRGSAETAGLYVRIAVGDAVHALPDGSYAVGDFRHYVVPGRSESRPIVRRSGGREELIVPVSFQDGDAAVSYEIIW